MRLTVIAGTIAIGAIIAVGAGVASPPAHQAATVTIKVADNKFVPDAKTIKKGTKVRFKWVGENPHSVVAVKVPKGAGTFHSATQTSGTYSHAFTVKGKYHMKCGVHGEAMPLDIRVS